MPSPRRFHSSMLLLAYVTFGTGCLDTNLEPRPEPDSGPRSDLVDDASTGTDAGTTSAQPALGSRHPACDKRAPSSAPALSMSVDAFAEEVNAWRAIPCELANAQPTCGPGEACDDSSPICFRADEKRANGVCGPDPLTERDPAPTLLSYRDGACVVNVRPEDKAAACCRGLVGFDCRTYPFGTLSAKGQRCASHDDCEEGLVCAEPGLCTCPGEAPIIDDPTCLPHHEALPWPSVPLAEGKVGDCQAAPEGYRIEQLDAQVNRNARAALAPDGKLHVFYAHEGTNGVSLRHAAQTDQGFQTETLDIALPAAHAVMAEPAGVVIDPQGFVHLVLATHGVRYVTNRSGEWKALELVTFDVPSVAAIGLAPDGIPSIAYASQGQGLRLARFETALPDVTSIAAELTAAPTRVSLHFEPGDESVAARTHVIVELERGPAFHYFSATNDFVQKALSFERVDAWFGPVPGQALALGATRAPTGRVQFCRLAEDCEVDSQTQLVWEQPASRYERVASTVAIAAVEGGMFFSYTTPEGRVLALGTLDASETVTVTTDLSPAAIVADAAGLYPHLFIAGGRSLFHVSKGQCPAP